METLVERLELFSPDRSQLKVITDYFVACQNVKMQSFSKVYRTQGNIKEARPFRIDIRA